MDFTTFTFPVAKQVYPKFQDYCKLAWAITHKWLHHLVALHYSTFFNGRTFCIDNAFSTETLPNAKAPMSMEDA